MCAQVCEPLAYTTDYRIFWAIQLKVFIIYTFLQSIPELLRMGYPEAESEEGAPMFTKPKGKVSKRKWSTQRKRQIKIKHFYPSQ